MIHALPSKLSREMTLHLTVVRITWEGMYEYVEGSMIYNPFLLQTTHISVIMEADQKCVLFL